MRKPIVALSLALCATFSLAAVADEYNTSYGRITRVVAYGENFRVYGLNLAPNPGSCANTGSAYIDPSLSIAKKEGLNRAVMAALLSANPVKVKLRSGSCSGDGHPLIYGILTS